MKKILLLCLLLFSCDEDDSNSYEDLIGTWSAANMIVTINGDDVTTRASGPDFIMSYIFNQDRSCEGESFIEGETDCFTGLCTVDDRIITLLSNDGDIINANYKLSNNNTNLTVTISQNEYGDDGEVIDYNSLIILEKVTELENSLCF